jgi:hypothetical protein
MSSGSYSGSYNSASSTNSGTYETESGYDNNKNFWATRNQEPDRRRTALVRALILLGFLCVLIGACLTIGGGYSSYNLEPDNGYSTNSGAAGLSVNDVYWRTQVTTRSYLFNCYDMADEFDDSTSVAYQQQGVVQDAKTWQCHYQTAQYVAIFVVLFPITLVSLFCALYATFRLRSTTTVYVAIIFASIVFCLSVYAVNFYQNSPAAADVLSVFPRNDEDCDDFNAQEKAAFQAAGYYCYQSDDQYDALWAARNAVWSGLIINCIGSLPLFWGLARVAKASVKRSFAQEAYY